MQVCHVVELCPTPHNPEVEHWIQQPQLQRVLAPLHYEDWEPVPVSQYAKNELLDIGVITQV